MYFSVIVTVYNVEPYLKTCVDSILAQTYRDFELILVDDGSPDGAAALCDAYAAQDSRIRVIHQPNAGVVRARQAGLRAAAGEYILFVDGDDWISPQYLIRGRELLEKTRAELVVFASLDVYENNSRTIYGPVPEGLYSRETLEEQIFPVLLMDRQMQHISHTCWGKIFCRSLAEKGIFSVDSGITLGEDTLSVLPAYLEMQSVYISREAMYFYRIREQSVCHSFRLEHYRQVELVIEALEKLKEQEPCLPKDFDGQIKRYGAFMCFALMIQTVERGCGQYWKEIKARMNRPCLKKCICGARFQGITIKTRITYMLFRRNMIFTAYIFLRVCQGLKACLRRRTHDRETTDQYHSSGV